MHDLLRKLAGGDRRSIGQSDRVVCDVLKQPSLFAVVIEGVRHSDPLVRMRCADVAEKVTRPHPEWLTPHKAVLLALAAQTTEQELRWHLAQMLPRLPLTPAEMRCVIARLLEYLADDSSIVKTFAMQARSQTSPRATARCRRSCCRCSKGFRLPAVPRCVLGDGASSPSFRRWKHQQSDEVFVVG